MHRDITKRHSLLSLTRVAFCSAIFCSSSALSANADSLGAFVTSDGWVVGSDRGFSECGTVSSPRYGSASEIIHDPSHNLSLFKFSVRNAVALRPELTVAEGERLSVIFQNQSGAGLTVRNRRVASTTGAQGDASYVRIPHARENRNLTQFVLSSDAALVGVVSGWEDNRETARVAKAGYIALLLASHGHDYSINSTANRIQESLVNIECGPETGDELGFNEFTLSAFGAETWARAFTQLYQEAWSSPNSAALSFVDQVYGERVRYFGKNLSRAAIADDKESFANRWNYRSYSLREEELSITCGSARCTIEGVNDYFTFGSEIDRTSSGIAQFSFDLDLRTLRISREDSSVISRTGADPEGMFLDWAQSTRNCATGSDLACERSEYLEVVMSAFGYCVSSSRPRGRLNEVIECT